MDLMSSQWEEVAVFQRAYEPLNLLTEGNAELPPHPSICFVLWLLERGGLGGQLWKESELKEIFKADFYVPALHQEYKALFQPDESMLKYYYLHKVPGSDRKNPTPKPVPPFRPELIRLLLTHTTGGRDGPRYELALKPVVVKLLRYHYIDLGAGEAAAAAATKLWKVLCGRKELLASFDLRGRAENLKTWGSYRDLKVGCHCLLPD
jgi:hypothetical protein